MYDVISLSQTNRAVTLINQTNLHSRPLEPIDPLPLFKTIPVFATQLLPLAQAVATKWNYKKKNDLRMVLYDPGLDEEPESAQKRRMLVHEYGHFFFNHEGNVFYLYRRTEDAQVRDSFGALVFDHKERQCDALAALLLLPLAAVKEYSCEGDAYLARRMDVPLPLVDMRYRLFQKRGC